MTEPGCIACATVNAYENGRPKNAAGGLQTVTAIDLLAEVNTACPLLLAEMTLPTALRTAATSARPLRQPPTGGIGRDA